MCSSMNAVMRRASSALRGEGGGNMKDSLSPVTAGHSRWKNGVAPLVHVPAIHVFASQKDVDARAEPAHDGIPFLRRHEPAQAGEGGEMMVRVAEQRIDHGDALEIVADLRLHGHADAAVQLDRALADD